MKGRRGHASLVFQKRLVKIKGRGDKSILLDHKGEGGEDVLFLWGVGVDVCRANYQSASERETVSNLEKRWFGPENRGSWLFILLEGASSLPRGMYFERRGEPRHKKRHRSAKN